ncbi:hypothetical protein EYF80_049593 [Liparis tanakae]|uniref:Fibronectin type-III domain-containing protein n=1 Tax=Liparis tanakae TaxID=230148 RepID=A0A4Z2FJ01_9TELE|nr:hypothetical protein EYF80_049593 [Liparis tanakae]
MLYSQGDRSDLSPLPDTPVFSSLRVRVEHLDVNGRVVARARHRLPGLIRIFRLQVVYELHGGRVGRQLQRPLAAGLQLKGNVDGPVDGQAQAVDTDLPVTPAFQQLLTACQLRAEIRLHVDVDVVAPLRELPGETLPQGVLHRVHLDSRRECDSYLFRDGTQRLRKAVSLDINKEEGCKGRRRHNFRPELKYFHFEATFFRHSKILETQQLSLQKREETQEPNPPVQFEVYQATTESLSLRWDTPAGEVESYIVTCCHEADVVLESTDTNTLTLSHLKPGVCYSLRVSTQLRNGRISKPAATSAQTNVFHDRDQYQKKAEEFTRCCLKPAVKDFVYRSLGPDIIGEMLTNEQFSTRMSFQYSVLLDLLGKDDFQNYRSYICSYEEHVKKWILDQIVERFSEDSTMFEFEDRHVQSSIRSINAAVNKAKTEKSANF